MVKVSSAQKKIIKEMLGYSKDAYNDISKMGGKPIFGKTGLLRGGAKETRNAQAMVYRDDSNGKIIAFEGSDTIADWFKNIDVRIKNLGKLKVHTGFYNYVDLLYDELKDELKDVDDFKITGHSLGAASASIFAYRYFKETGKKPSSLINFASPRPFYGNTKDFDDNLDLLRIARSRDSFTMAPLNWVGHSHAGIPYIQEGLNITARKKGFNEDNSFAYLTNQIVGSVKMALMGELSFLAGHALTGVPLTSKFPSQNFKDHIENIQRAADVTKAQIDIGDEKFKGFRDMLAKITIDSTNEDRKPILNVLRRWFNYNIRRLEGIKKTDPEGFAKFWIDIKSQINQMPEIDERRYGEALYPQQFLENDLGGALDFLTDSAKSILDFRRDDLLNVETGIQKTLKTFNLLQQPLVYMGVLGKLGIAKDMLNIVGNTLDYHKLDQYEETVNLIEVFDEIKETTMAEHIIKETAKGVKELQIHRNNIETQRFELKEQFEEAVYQSNPPLQNLPLGFVIMDDNINKINEGDLIIF